MAVSLGCFVLQQKSSVGPDVYVLKLECNCDASAVAVATSENFIGVSDPSTLSVIRRLEGHCDGIEDLSFFQSSPFCLTSCSRDGTARIWDLRASDAVARSVNLSTDEACSCSVGRGDSALACSANEKVHIIDVGTGKRARVFKDCHTDIVTQVRFHPVETSRLLTGSLDGLACLLDTNQPKEDAAMLGVVPNEECIQSISMVGPGRSTLCSVSTTNQVRIWGIGADDFGERKAEFLNIRAHPLLAREDSPGYVIQTFYDEPSQQVFLLAGSGEDSSGTRMMALFRVALPDAEPVATFSGTSEGIVRSALCLPGGTVLTAGEDGIICAWRQGMAAPVHDAESVKKHFQFQPTAYGAQRGSGPSDRAVPY